MFEEMSEYYCDECETELVFDDETEDYHCPFCGNFKET